MSTVSKVIAFVRLGRPLFLVGGFVLYALGALVAAHAGVAVDAARYATGQLVVTAFQLMTHYANDYFDYDADVANTTPTKWSGGSRVLVERELPRAAALVGALGCAAIGVSASVVLATRPGSGPLLVPILLTILVLAWEYSGPPLRLHSTGFGELDTALVVTVLVPLTGFYVQAGSLDGASVLALATAPLCALQLAMLLAIELPDAVGDAKTGKRTIVVRFGGARSAWLYAALTALAYLALPVLVMAGLPLRVAALAALPAPIALWRIARVLQGQWRERERWEGLAFWAVALLIATSGSEVAAFALLPPLR